MKTTKERTCGRCGEHGHHHHDCHRIHDERRIKTGLELISAERARQIEMEGFTPEHDDTKEGKRQLARAAESYISHYTAYAWTFANELKLNIKDGPATYRGERAPDPWPWNEADWKPKSPLEDLIRAGALIAAEIDRLQRANSSNAKTEVRQ